MKTIQYPIVCPSCKGLGRIRNPIFELTTEGELTLCPACKGERTVIAIETESETQFGTFSNPRP